MFFFCFFIYYLLLLFPLIKYFSSSVFNSNEPPRLARGEIATNAFNIY